MPIKPRKRPIKFVEETISKAPHLEHSFIKRSRCQIEDVTQNNTTVSTNFNLEKMTNYQIRTIGKGGTVYTIHTHPKTDPLSMIPSIVDIVESRKTSVVYVNKGKTIEGQVHFHLRPEFEKSFENFRKRIKKTKQQLLEINKYNKPMASEVQQSFEQDASRVDLVNELLSRDAGRKFFQKEAPRLIINQYNSDFRDFCLRNRLFHPEEIINYFKYKYLFFDNKKTTEMYELLGIQLKFVANKYGGYRFDPKTVDFIKK